MKPDTDCLNCEPGLKTIGLLGGMTCESSLEYYRLINDGIRKGLGGIHSAKSVMLSVDFGDISPLLEAGDWDGIVELLATAARRIECAGADFLVICTNTIHKLADEIARSISIPILNIIDATAAAIREQNLTRVGLLGTRFTMSEDFYRRRLLDRHGIQTLIPDADQIEFIQHTIMDELSVGIVDPGSQQEFHRIIASLESRGAQGVILGCTEIPLLVRQQAGGLPLLDTTAIHARAAVAMALAGLR